MGKNDLEIQKYKIFKQITLFLKYIAFIFSNCSAILLWKDLKLKKVMIILDSFSTRT